MSCLCPNIRLLGFLLAVVATTSTPCAAAPALSETAERPVKAPGDDAAACDDDAKQNRAATPKDGVTNENSDSRCGPSKDVKESEDSDGHLITAIVSIAVACISLIGALGTVFAARSGHGEKMGRLRVSGYRFDAT